MDLRGRREKEKWYLKSVRGFDEQQKLEREVVENLRCVSRLTSYFGLLGSHKHHRMHIHAFPGTSILKDADIVNQDGGSGDHQGLAEP